MKRTTRTLMLSATIVATCYALPGMAQPQNMTRGPMSFGGFDRNGDGVITSQEFDAARAERMAAMAQAGAPMRGAANAPSFADFDANGDGRITPDEFAASRQARMQNRPGAGMGPGYGSGPSAGMGPGYGRGMGPGMGRGMGMGRNMPSFSAFDLNHDGILTEKEFYEARAKRIAQRSQQGYPMRNLTNAPEFGAIDLNGDGKVDPREFSAAQAEHRRQMMQQRMAPQNRY